MRRVTQMLLQAFEKGRSAEEALHQQNVLLLRK